MNRAVQRSAMILLAAAATLLADASTSRPASAPADGEWPMWGYAPDRNMVSAAKGVPDTWDVKSGSHIKWAAPLGTQTFGNPVVSGGKVFIGTNNGAPRDPAVKGDKGVLMAFAAADGRFLWQAVHDKHPGGDANDWSDIGICSTPAVVGDRIYYVSNRGELVCADTEGFLDGQNDGPLTTEARSGPQDADLVWVLDMVDVLKVVPFSASASCPLVWNDLVFVVTGNGIDPDSGKTKNPQAPSFIAVDGRTGKLIWQDNSPGEHIIAGQWSSPALGMVKGEPQVVFPGGDGWLYAFKPATGELLWKFNCNAHAPAGDQDSNEDRNSLVATPVFVEGKVTVASGQDPEKGDGDGCLRAIDASLRGDVTGKAEAWRLAGSDFGRSVSNVAVADSLLYAVELGGYLNCIDPTSGKRHWRYDLKASIWSSPVVADGKVYLANTDGDVFIFRHSAQPTEPRKLQLGGAIHGSAAVTDGVLYWSDRSRLYAVSSKQSKEN